jgi:hypothetical protein
MALMVGYVFDQRFGEAFLQPPAFWNWVFSQNIFPQEGIRKIG